jgi:predicted RNA binding protein YcfA (HicA-like mRNA interferase family)
MALAESKRIQRLYEQVQRTRKNCAFEDIERLLLALGFTERKASGSHRIFKLRGLAVSVPQRRPVKENYVDQVIAIVQELGIP